MQARAMARLAHYARMLHWKFIVPKRLQRAGVTLGADVTCLGEPIVSFAPDSEIVVGARSTLCSDSRYTALGVNHPVILRTLRPRARIVIGDDSGISGATICAAVEVRIGVDNLIGANVTIVDTDFHALKADGRRHNNNPSDIGARPVRIGDNVFIGTGAMVLKGVTVGNNSVVGAGAVVVRDVPANAIVAGNPAKIIGNID